MHKLVLIFLFVFLCLQVVSAKIYDFTEGNKLTLLQEPKAAAEYKLKLIRKAQHHIHIMSYSWDNSAFSQRMTIELKKAHERGVEIRILTTSFATKMLDFKMQGYKSLTEQYSKGREGAILSFLLYKKSKNQTFTNNLHEKLFLVDGKLAILGGRNVATSSYETKDLEIALEGPVVNQIQDHFHQMYSYVLRLKINSSCRKNNSSCSEQLKQTNFENDDLAYFPEQTIYQGEAKARILTHDALIMQDELKYNSYQRPYMSDDILDTIMKVKFTKLRFYSFFILPVPRFKSFLEEQLRQNKSINIITNSLETAASISNKGYLVALPTSKALVEQNLNLYQWQGKDGQFYLHEKVMLFDDDHGLIGSHNFGIASTAVSNEIVVEFFSKPIVQTLIDVFEKEMNDVRYTKKANLSSLVEQIKKHAFTIKFLHLHFLRRLVEEFF